MSLALGRHPFEVKRGEALVWWYKRLWRESTMLKLLQAYLSLYETYESRVLLRSY